jgi:hypothetical protein
MITITSHAAVSSINTTTHPERKSRNRVRVHAITRKKKAVEQSEQEQKNEEEEIEEKSI